MRLTDLVDMILNETEEEKLIELAKDISIKAEGIAYTLKSMDSTAKMVEEEAKALAEKARIIRNKEKSLKGYALEAMQAMGLEKLPAGVYNLRRQNNPPSVRITGDIDAKYIKTKIVESEDKTAIKNDLKKGIIVDGAELVTSERLVVK